MEAARKITVGVSPELLARAQRASGVGITETVRTRLQLVAASFLQGSTGPDVDLLDRALAGRQVLMPPVVLTEILSDPKLPAETADSLADLPMIAPGSDFWLRAGALRASVLARKRKARLGDALIAQSCLDAGVALVTRDREFRAFVAAAGLDLALP